MPALTAALKGIFSRFVPSLVAVMGVICAALVLADPHGLSKSFLGVAGTEIGGIAIGYAAAFAALGAAGRERRSGRGRHAIAGLVAPFILGAMSPLVQAIGLSEILALSVGTGVVTGLLFWATLKRGPGEPQPSLEELERKADAELALLDPHWRDGIRSIAHPDKHKLPKDRVA
jgi:hypothetical protein